MRVIVIASLLALSACQASRKPVYDLLPKSTTPYKLSDALKEKVKVGVARDLKDPDSARFEPLFVAASDGEKLHVCGYVNGKNSYGGYAGMKPFYAVGDASIGYFAPFSIGSDSFTEDLIYDLCRRVGAPLEYSLAAGAARR